MCCSQDVACLLKTCTIKNQSTETDRSELQAGLPQSGKNIWKVKFFPGQGKVREFCGWSGKFRKNLESQGIKK